MPTSETNCALSPLSVHLETTEFGEPIFEDRLTMVRKLANTVYEADSFCRTGFIMQRRAFLLAPAF